MHQSIAHIALVVPDYDEALSFYVDGLGFECLEDTTLGDGKRWVRVAPSGGQGSALLLAKADGEIQARAIGNQAGGRVFLFLETDDFHRDYARYKATGVIFLEAPRTEPYGIVAVFQDPFGNRWDLIQPR